MLNWRERIERLLEDTDRWQQRRGAGLAHAREHYSHRHGLMEMGQAMQRLGLPVQEVSP